MKETLSRYKGSFLQLWGNYMMIDYMQVLPYDIPKVFMGIQTSKFTMSYSNMSGPKEPFNWDGSKCNWYTAFLPAFGPSLCAITAFSQADAIQMGLVSDTNSIDNPDVFMELLNKNVA